MNKLRHIPRAIADLFYPWKYPLQLQEKSSLTYTLFLIKWKNWLGKNGNTIRFRLFGKNIEAGNHRSLQFLVKEIFVQQVYRVPVTEAINAILDLGSNIGLSVVYFRRCFPTAYIQAWEPAADSFKLLDRNVGGSDAKLELVNKAVSDRNGFLYADANSNIGSVNARFNRRGSIAVEAVRLSTVLKNSTFDLLKMDIEGEEDAVLTDCDAEQVLSSVKIWLIEFHSDNSALKWNRRFEELGYRGEKRESVYCFYK